VFAPRRRSRNTRIWIAVLVIGTEWASVQIGGSRATAVTSDRHAARLVFHSASVRIADSAPLNIALLATGDERITTGS